MLVTRSHLKKRILGQNRGGREDQTGGILQYFEDMSRAPNKEFGPKNFFEIASSLWSLLASIWLLDQKHILDTDLHGLTQIISNRLTAVKGLFKN